MNREIKFRVFSSRTGMWSWEKLKGNHPEPHPLSCLYSHDGWHVMQYTGMKDKNGKEIYEGDIGEIKTQSGRLERFVVKWGVHRREMKSGWTVDIPGFCFEVDGFPTFPIVNNYVNGHDLDIIEIIGNIFENPELLQTNKDKEDARQ